MAAEDRWVVVEGAFLLHKDKLNSKVTYALHHFLIHNYGVLFFAAVRYEVASREGFVCSGLLWAQDIPATIDVAFFLAGVSP